MRKAMNVMASVLFNAAMGCVLFACVGLPAMAGAVVANAIALVCGGWLPAGALGAGVLKEIWTGELVKTLRGFVDGSWLEGVPDNSSIVENDVIHLVDVGVDPDVLVNNTTYPIPVQALDDADVGVSLDKFQTKATPITDDELYAISYDKMARVKDAHADAIAQKKFVKAAHALCASGQTAKTPVLSTTGERDAETDRKKLSARDVMQFPWDEKEAVKAATNDTDAPSEAVPLEEMMKRYELAKQRFGLC